MPMKIKILGFAASILLRVLKLTYRYKLEFNSDEQESTFKKYITSKKPNFENAFLLAFFHQDELALIPYFKNTGFSVF